ncbi:MAG: 16S rRNA (uracil(1498)-N(3))-methyltransferase [Halioglobus sp.]|nr:16S rRNA (uracil(1498)-N(3))-methyltransferase [Halioglobus sp.]
MNLLLFTSADRVGAGHIALRDQRLHHLLHVLHSEVGDTLRVGELGGAMGSAVVVAISPLRALLQVGLDQAPPPKLPLDLVLALPRPKMLRRMLRTVAELGVPRLHLINSYRVEKSYWGSPLLQPQALQHCMRQGLEQARDTVLPQVRCHRLFKPFVEDEFPALAGGRRALLAHPGDHPACPRGAGGATVLVIGPEGGFIPYEVDKLAAAGCTAVSLGPRILRVETALTNILGRLF